MTKIINKTVNVTAIKFGKNFSAYPAKMELDGRTYCFIDSGLNVTVRRRGVVSQVLTLTDGLQQFTLRGDSHGAWTLLSMSA